MLVLPSCSALSADADGVDLALDDECLLKESESKRSKPSKEWQEEESRSVDRLGRSSRCGGSLRSSEVCEPQGAA
jgi:hypothetical protein